MMRLDKREASDQTFFVHRGTKFVQSIVRRHGLRSYKPATSGYGAFTSEWVSPANIRALPGETRDDEAPWGEWPLRGSVPGRDRRFCAFRCACAPYPLRVWASGRL